MVNSWGSHSSSLVRRSEREVSSRFMSPVSSSSSFSSSSAVDSPRYHQHHSNNHNNQRSISDQRLRRQLKMVDGNENRPLETTCSLDSPFPLQQDGGGGKTHNQNQIRSKPPLKENCHPHDTPTPILPPPSRSRLNQQRLLTSSAASRLLRFSVSSDGEDDINRERTNGSKLFNNVPASPLNRSLSTSFSCDDASLFREARASFSLPPVAHNSKVQGETKKQKKALGQHADQHSLKLLHNRHLQWRFANANAEIKTQSLKTQTEVESKELAKVLADASKSMEGIAQNIGNFTQEMETLMYELARVSSVEKASIQDCGVTLLKTHSSHLIQHQKKMKCDKKASHA